LVAVTVKTEELPAVIELGLAAMLTVGGCFGCTVTVVVAVIVPPAPVAVAVYFVVAAGVTDWVPPVGCRLYELPSEPVTVT
jgi:CHASE2 domain-containing sensor protein